MKTKILLLFLLLIACASQRQVVQEGDALDLLSDLTKELQSEKLKLTEARVTEITAEMDSLCEDEIVVSPVNNIEKLEKQVKNTSQLDNLLINHADQTHNHHLEASVRELKFRTLVKTQERMVEYFHNEGTLEKTDAGTDSMNIDKARKIKKGEVHGNWIFEQNVSMMLPYMQAGERISKEKTRHLSEMIDLLSEFKTLPEKKRCWLAIDRMLNEIDVQKSEVGYTPFQRSPYGIYTKQGEIIEKLKVLHEKETDEEIRAFSATVINKLEQNLNAKRKGEFWDRVENSRQLNEKLKTEGYRLEGSFDDLELPTIEGLTASEWFDKGFAEPDENLKIKYYSRAIKLNPQYAAAYNNRGDAYQASGRIDEAFKDFSKAIEFNAENAPAYINRGNIYQKMEKHPEAVQDFSRAISLNSKYALAYNNRGSSYKKLGEYKKALKDFNMTIQLEPKFFTAYFNRGDVLRKMGKDQEAISDYTKAIDLDPNNSVALNNRGFSHNNLGQYQKAIQDYLRAIEITPDYAAAYYNLGVAYWTLNRWKDVVQAWEKSLELNPDQSYINLYLPKAREQARKAR